MTLYEPKIVPFPHTFTIQPFSGTEDPHSYFLHAVQQVIDAIIPESLWLEMKSRVDSESLFYRLASLLPIFQLSEIQEHSTFFTLTYLCPAEYAHPAKRYVADAIHKQLIPGKQVETSGGISLKFQFAGQNLPHRFFIAQERVLIKSREEAVQIRSHLPDLIAQLKQKLSPEGCVRSENVVHPIFMPRNEEELIRNLIVLTSQIKYVRDLPQVSIHYEKQTEVDLTFTVIVARLLKNNAEPLRALLGKSSLKMDIDDVRTLGYLKQKYPKETAVLRVTLDKRPFFRRDDSLDVLRARQKIGSQLTLCLGEFRDFNGGMILKQEEALAHLREELGKLSQQSEFLLENYFYSLMPGIMQTVHETALLKNHFQLFNKVLGTDLQLQPYQMIEKSVGKFFLCFIAATSPSFKEAILHTIRPLNISSRDLTTSFLQVENRSMMGFIFKAETGEAAEQFHGALLSALHEWSRRFHCLLR